MSAIPPFDVSIVRPPEDLRKFLDPVVLSAPWFVLKGWEKVSQEAGNHDVAVENHFIAVLVVRHGGVVVMASVAPTRFSELVISALLTEGDKAEATLALVTPVITRFGTFVEEGLGVTTIDAVGPEHVLTFMDARRQDGTPPDYGTRRVRRMALRMAFRTGRRIGACEGDPTLDLDIGPLASVSSRPLTDPEVERCRIYALPSPRDMRRCIAWALAEATARTSEMGLVVVGDVDLATGRVRLPGAPGTAPRWGYLTEWGRVQLERRLSTSPDPNASLMVWRSPPKVPRAASSQAIKETLKAAGLTQPGVNARSVTAWVGRTLYDDGHPLDEVARRLGMRSLDQTASFIGFDWRQEEA